VTARAEVGAPAPAITLLRTDGSEAALGELIGDRPTVLLFLRHYG